MKLTPAQLDALRAVGDGNITFFGGSSGYYMVKGFWQKPNQQKFRALRDAALIQKFNPQQYALGDDIPVVLTTKGREVLNKHKES